MHKCTLFLPLFELKGFRHDPLVRQNVLYVEFVAEYVCYRVHTIKFSLKKIKCLFRRKCKGQRFGLISTLYRNCNFQKLTLPSFNEHFNQF